MIFLVEVSALSFLQCFHNVGWVTGRESIARKKFVAFISRGSFFGKKIEGGQLALGEASVCV